MYMILMERIAKSILRAGLALILLSLLYICFYIYIAAPDGGVMTEFRLYVSEMLGCSLAALGILVASAAIPEVRLF